MNGELDLCLTLDGELSSGHVLDGDPAIDTELGGDFDLLTVVDGSVSINENIDGELGTFYVGKDIPLYDGETTVTPSESSTILETDGCLMESDITVDPIPSNYIDPSDTTAEVNDVTNGKTFYGADRQKKTGTFVADTHAWWGGVNAVKLWETDYSLKLSDTNFSSLTPSTSSQNLTLPATSYSSASTAVTIDRYGTNYHGGAALDFVNYDYYVLIETMVNVAYTSDEATMGKGHMLQQDHVYLYSLGQSFRVSSESVIEPSSTVSGTNRAHGMGFVNSKYRAASNTIGLYASTSYGLGLSASAPTFSSSTSLSPAYINFRSPVWLIRTSSTYHNSAAWQYIDADNTTLVSKQALYRVDKSGPTEVGWQILQHMWENNSLPSL